MNIDERRKRRIKRLREHELERAERRRHLRLHGYPEEPRVVSVPRAVQAENPFVSRAKRNIFAGFQSLVLAKLLRRSTV